MRRIIVFEHVTVDGFFAGPRGEIDWFNKNKDDEYNEFSNEAAKSGGTLIFGHTTYELMKSFWPTSQAFKINAVMAAMMNGISKIVFSKTLHVEKDGPIWKNVKVLHEIKSQDILEMKELDGKHITILGSGSIVQQFANLKLIDEYQLMVNPVILGTGKYLFKDVKKNELKLISTRTFKNGNVLLCYQA